MTKEYVANILNEKIKNHEIGMLNGKLQGLITGAFGDTINCEAIYDGKVEPEKGGIFTKILGCSYLFRTHPIAEITEGIGLAKSFISAFPREIISKNFIYELSILITYLFNKKKFYRELDVFSWNLYYHVIYKYGDLLDIKYSVPVREIKRATKEIIKKRLNKKEFDFDSLSWYRSESKEETFLSSFYNIIRFICFFIEFDNAYRYRLQDASENIIKENIQKNVIKEIKRILDLIISRENPEYGGIEYKWIRMKKIIIPALYLIPDLRKLVKELLLEINFDKIRLSESDWYFCLKRAGYKFRGLSYQERLKIKRKIDNEKGHISVSIKIDEQNNKADIKIYKSMRILYPIKKGTLVQPFGVDNNFYIKNFGINGHNGIDIVSYHGDEILCPEDGFVHTIYDNKTGSVSKGFGVSIIGLPDENGICNQHIVWHTMSNIQVKQGNEVSQGQLLAYEGDSGFVFVGGVAVPDSQKGFPPYPGTHLHWGVRKLKRVQQPPLNTCLADINGKQFKDKDGFFYDIQDYNNGTKGYVDPLKEDLIYFDEWSKEQLLKEIIDVSKKAVNVIPTLPKEEKNIWIILINEIISKVVNLFKK